MLEVIPDTREMYYDFESPSIVVSEGETIAVKYIVEPGITTINRVVFFKISHNSGSYLVGTSRTLTYDDDEWIDKVLVESTGKDKVNGRCPTGDIDGPIYLLLKVVSGGDAKFAYGGILATSDSYKFTAGGTVSPVDNLAFAVMYPAPDYWYEYFPLRSWLNYKFGFAIEFKIPDNPAFNALEGGILQHMPSGYTQPMAGGWASCIFGFSKVLTMDETQWECRMGWLQREHGMTMNFGGASVICQPGETWYLIGKMKTEGLKYVGYGASKVDYPDVKSYYWHDYDIDDYSEIDTIFGFEIYVQRDEPFFADFRWSPAYPKPGEEIQFTDKSHPELVDSWEWAFELGQYSHEQNPTYAFSEEGNYIVTLTATSVHGTPIEVNKQIRVGFEECPDFSNRNDCENAGCYWWGESCHSYPQPEIQIPWLLIIAAGAITAGVIYLLTRKK